MADNLIHKGAQPEIVSGIDTYKIYSQLTVGESTSAITYKPVEVYPCANRNGSIDPEARLNTEDRLIKIGNTVNIESYIVSKTPAESGNDGEIVFYIGNYYFALHNLTAADLTQITSATPVAIIRTHTVGVDQSGMSSIYNFYTKLLSSVYSTTETLDVLLSGSTNYDFDGLCFVAKANAEAVINELEKTAGCKAYSLDLSDANNYFPLDANDIVCELTEGTRQSLKDYLNNNNYVIRAQVDGSGVLSFGLTHPTIS